MKIALATCAALPQLDTDNQLVLSALRALNADVTPVIWEDPAVDWSMYNLCVIRSTWDYVPKRAEYLQWAAQVASQTTLWNPLPVLQWNTDKKYLKDLHTKGIPIVKTEWLQAGSNASFEALIQARRWDEVVIKPVISAAGRNTYLLNEETLPAKEGELQALLSEHDMMIQPFMSSIHTTGELSLMFIDGKFSHAVAKKPAKQDFRVHEHLGGETKPYVPTDAQRKFAEQVMQSLAWPTLYGRVDIVLNQDGQPRLMELELTEPSMYLVHDPESPHRFANAIQSKLQALTLQVN